MAFDLSKLGVELNIPKVNFLEYTGIIEAPEKWGKTTFAALYPNAVLIAAEEGYKAQVVNKRSVSKWKDFVNFINLLEKHREEIGDDIQTIVLDTVDKLYPMAADEVIKEQSLNDKKRYLKINDIPYGQGWNLHDKEFEKQINRILSMGFTILYLTHSTVKQIKPKNGEPYDVYKATMPDRCANIIYPACDYIIRGERTNVEVGEGETENKRVMVVQGNDESVAGNRVYFEQPIVFDTEEEAMEKFQQKFREGIERNLKKAGITKDIDELEKEQNEERKKKVDEFIKESKIKNNTDELKKQLKSICQKLDKDGKGNKVKTVLKSALGKINFNEVDDGEKLNEALDQLNNL